MHHFLCLEYVRIQQVVLRYGVEPLEQKIGIPLQKVQRDLKAAFRTEAVWSGKR